MENSPIMIFLLGGPPKVGKSTISGKIQQIHAVSVVSTDSIGAILENVWNDETAPDLFVKEKFTKMTTTERENLSTSDFIEYINYVKNESLKVWKAVFAFIKRENEEGRDLLIEGVAVLPKFVNQLEDIPHRVVFIGNQGENHKENIRKSALENEYDWMRDRSDEYYRIFALFVNRMSVYIKDEADKYGFEYIEMNNRRFGSVTEEVMRSFQLSVR